MLPVSVINDADNNPRGEVTPSLMYHVSELSWRTRYWLCTLNINGTVILP